MLRILDSLQDDTLIYVLKAAVFLLVATLTEYGRYSLYYHTMF